MENEWGRREAWYSVLVTEHSFSHRPDQNAEPRYVFPGREASVVRPQLSCCYNLIDSANTEWILPLSVPVAFVPQGSTPYIIKPVGPAI